jgi:nucleoside-diphosphate-sugar epimerase
MKSVCFFRKTAVTGSSGFIGSHFCRALSATLGPGEAQPVDVCSPADLQRARGDRRVQTLVHLAAKGSVLAAGEAPAQMATSLEGTLHCLGVLQPRRVVLASSCAVYGETGARGAAPSWKSVHPVSLYGISKAAAELIVRHWVVETGATAVILRLGNVIGEGCPGLIRYLVRHAVRFPGGSEPAQLRGAGRVVRDYIPVEYVVRVMQRVLELRMRQGTCLTLNAGSGHGLTNRFVAERVQTVLAARGYRLALHFSDHIAPGEAWRVTLDIRRTTRRLGVAPPELDAVAAAIERAALDWLETETPPRTSPTMSVPTWTPAALGRSGGD